MSAAFRRDAPHAAKAAGLKARLAYKNARLQSARADVSVRVVGTNGHAFVRIALRRSEQ